MNWLKGDPMKSVKVFLLIAAAAYLNAANLVGQSSAVATHVAAAKAAAGTVWPSLVKSLCGSAEGPPPPPAPAAAPAPATPPPPPPRSAWYHEPVKVFDNVYLLPQMIPESLNGVSSWAITTSGGIILIDTLYDYSVKEGIDAALKSVRLNPANIKAAFVTHGHGDHFGGAKYLQELYSTSIYAGALDWDLMQASANAGSLGQPIPKKDLVATNGMKYTLGDTTITVYLTPGHTPSTLSFLIPVKINGQPHVAAFWGGTAISRNSREDNLKVYSESARRFKEIVTQAKADIMLSNHDAYGEYFAKIEQMKKNPSGPNPFVVGTDGVRRYLDVLDHCGQAQVAAKL